MIGVKIRSLLLLSMLVLGAAGLFVIQVWKQNGYVTLAKNHRELKRQVKRLKSDIANIELRNKALKNFSRLEELGTERFGLVYPEVPVYVYPESHKTVKAESQWYSQLFTKK